MRFALILDLCQWQALTSNKWRSPMDTVEELPYLLLYFWKDLNSLAQVIFNSWFKWGPVIEWFMKTNY